MICVPLTTEIVISGFKMEIGKGLTVILKIYHSILVHLLCVISGIYTLLKLLSYI